MLESALCLTYILSYRLRFLFDLVSFVQVTFEASARNAALVAMTSAALLAPAQFAQVNAHRPHGALGRGG
jgi:hypothetical protein